MRPTYGSVLSNLNASIALLDSNLSVPGCCAYLDMLEMLLAKADVELAAYYEHRLVDEPSLEALGNRLRERFGKLNEELLKILDQQELLEKTPLIRQAIEVRNPYIDPLHGLQAELLQRNRDADGAISADLSRALMVTMAGIAAGLRNTG